MKKDWALPFFAYALSRYLFPIVSFGRVTVAPWDERAHAAWRIKRVGRVKIELGSELAGFLTCGLIAYECLSLWMLGQLLQSLP